MGRSLDSRPHPRRSRLSRSGDFDRVFRHGRSHPCRELVLHVFPREGDAGPPRLGLSVSRKVGGAVQRNRVKRLLREAFAYESAKLPPGTDAVVVARRDAWALAEREGLRGMRDRLGELISRASAGVVAEPAAALRGQEPSAGRGQEPSSGVAQISSGSARPSGGEPAAEDSGEPAAEEAGTSG